MIGSIGGVDLKREKVRELQLRAAGILLAGGVVFLQADPGLPGAGQTIYAEESAEDKAVDNTADKAKESAVDEAADNTEDKAEERAEDKAVDNTEENVEDESEDKTGDGTEESITREYITDDAGNLTKGPDGYAIIGRSDGCSVSEQKRHPGEGCCGGEHLYAGKNTGSHTRNAEGLFDICGQNEDPSV